MLFLVVTLAGCVVVLPDQRVCAHTWLTAMRACRTAITKLAIDRVISADINATLTKAQLRSTALAAFDQATKKVKTKFVFVY
jgi:hypothetical protein